MISGGVDSTVCAVLLKKALPDTEIIAVHVDNGFMRKNESQNVEQLLKKQGINVQGKSLQCYGHFYHNKDTATHTNTSY